MRHIRMNINTSKTLLSVNLSNKSLVELLCVALNADAVVTTGQSAAPGVAMSRLLYAPGAGVTQGPRQGRRGEGLICCHRIYSANIPPELFMLPKSRALSDNRSNEAA